MIQWLLKLRYIFIVGVLLLMINAVMFLVAAVIKAVEGYRFLMVHGLHPQGAERPGMFLLESLDLILVSIVFFVLGLGILKLIILSEKHNDKMPAWLKINGFIDLKIMLWETILVTLVVLAFTQIAARGTALDWNSVILPVIILILTLSLFLMNKHHK